jgi:hypothetical protein
MSELRNKHRFKNLAVHNLDQDDIGNESPNKNSSVVAFYERDSKVRKEVIQMAKGKCEYCSQEGFLKSDGARYLEAHHIIALSNQGKDMVINVIALCPNHHKETHYGKESKQLENKFIEIVKIESLVQRNYNQNLRYLSIFIIQHTLNQILRHLHVVALFDYIGFYAANVFIGKFVTCA